MDYINCCRICLSTSSKLIEIFVASTGLSLSEKIMYCASVEINPNDRLPQYICTLCKTNLDIAFKFKTVCEESNKKLQKAISMKIISICRTPQKFDDESVKDEIIFFDDSSLLREEIVSSNVEGEIKSNNSSSEGTVSPDNTDLVKLSNTENFDLKDGSPTKSKATNDVDEKVVVIQMNANMLADISKSVTEKLSKSPVGRHIAKKNSSQIPKKINRCTETLNNTSSSELKSLRPLSSTKTTITPRTKGTYSSSVSENSSDQSDHQFTCSICNKYYETYKQLMRHIKTHSEIKLYNCEICSKSFKNKYNLSIHSLKHSGKFPLKCRTCKRGFANMSVLNRHSISHNNDAPYICKYCKKRFPYEYSLRVHESIHIDRPKYTCDICFKLFSYKNSLSAHIKTHKSEKPHACKVCSSTFTRNTSLKRHIIQNHDHGTNRLFCCKVCEQEFQTKDECTIHEDTIHMKLKCDLCSRKFNTKSLLLKHLKIHSNFPCKLCNKIYKSNNALLLHCKRVH